MAGKPLRRTGIPSGNGPAGQMPRVKCRRFIEERGRQCNAMAEPGAAECRFHGGRAPTHRVQADEMVTDYKDRLLELGDYAISKLEQKMESPNEAVQLRAALEVLDRINVSGTRSTKVETTIHQRSELDDRIEDLLNRGSAPGSIATTSPTPEDDDVTAATTDE